MGGYCRKYQAIIPTNIRAGREGSSPYTRGSSLINSWFLSPIDLFPVHAGVIPIELPLFTVTGALPRTRGGHPLNSIAAKLGVRLFPVHAGVILVPCGSKLGTLALPRTRGGHPDPNTTELQDLCSSPYTRGSSLVSRR